MEAVFGVVASQASGESQRIPGNLASDPARALHEKIAAAFETNSTFMQLLVAEKLLGPETMNASLGELGITENTLIMCIFRPPFTFKFTGKWEGAFSGSFHLSVCAEDGHFEDIFAVPESRSKNGCDHDIRSKFESSGCEPLVAELKRFLESAQDKPYGTPGLQLTESSKKDLDDLWRFLLQAGPCRYVLLHKGQYNPGGGFEQKDCEALMADHRLTMNFHRWEPFTG